MPKATVGVDHIANVFHFRLLGYGKEDFPRLTRYSKKAPSYFNTKAFSYRSRYTT